MTLWLFRQRLSLSAQWCSSWERPQFATWNNGGRRENEVFDFNVNFWRLAASVTLWHIGGWQRVLRFLPGKVTL